MIDWNWIEKDNYDTYPREGHSVIVSDDVNYDVAWFVMSGEYRWVKNDLTNDTLNDFEEFEVVKWAYIEN